MARFKHAENLIKDTMAMNDLGRLLVDGADVLNRPDWDELGHALKCRKIPDLARLKEAIKVIEANAHELRGGANDWCLANLRLFVSHAEKEEASGN